MGRRSSTAVLLKVSPPVCYPAQYRKPLLQLPAPHIGHGLRIASSRLKKSTCLSSTGAGADRVRGLVRRAFVRPCRCG